MSDLSALIDFDATLTTVSTSNLVFNSYPTITSIISQIGKEEFISFSCPYCGTHYIARDPGFIPNCHNCGAIMRKGD